jgi:hypothetical protein
VSLTFDVWPFLPPESRLPEENERWWQQCYTPSPLEGIIEGHTQWCVLVGLPQTGKSTILAALRRKWQANAFIIDDDIFLSQDKDVPGNILYRILSRASWILRQCLLKNPDKYFVFSTTQKEFLRWSVEKFHGRRAFLRWLDGLPGDVVKDLEAIPYEDIYPSTSVDVDGQIEELVNITARLGYQKVVVIADTHPFPSLTHTEEIIQTLRWLEPMQHTGIKVVMALPPTFSESQARELTRGRANILQVHGLIGESKEVINKYLSVATRGNVTSVDMFCSLALLEKISLLLKNEFEGPTVGAWIKAIFSILRIVKQREGSHLDVDDFPDIQMSLFESCIPLRVGADKNQLGLWRGYKWIQVDRAIYDFVELLISHPGKYINHEIMKTSKGNLHTLASRLRNMIEPDSTRAVYLKNVKGEGYCLDKVIT